ncbi:putative elongation factor 2 kinase [Chaetomium sp. MPI-SDFR-AT-0129]|nr:putative elongation factor 2 kinase [Chaetomium sp. MPI-SDFR-AT-0129]
MCRLRSGHHSDAPFAQQSNGGRYNNATRATISDSELGDPFASGAFRWVGQGVYTTGPRSGQACVMKWFKTGAVFEKEYFTLDIKAVDRALELVNRFNELNIVNKTIKINVPTVWTFEEGSSWAGQKILVEPFIQNYQKFNSNTGWNDDSGAWPQVMQALSHFSYHASGGSEVLCDLQGGIYRHELILSDPVILSRAGDYGVTDLGSKGISSFFSQHSCNDFCRPNWTKPANPLRHFRPVSGTTMIRRTVPTAMSRGYQYSWV